MAAAADVLIQYLCREKLYGALFTECNKLRQKRGDDANVLFWRSFALGFQARGSQGDVFQSLESLRSKRDFALAAVHALRFFHRRQARPDDGEIESLDIAAEMTIETANDIALFNAANLLLHIEEHTEALKLLDRMSRSGSLAGNSLNIKANILRGWVELSVGVNPTSPTAMLEVESYFSSSLEADSLNIDAMLGLAKCKYHTQNWDGALEVLNRAIASQPLVPCLLDKARVMLSKGDCSQASSMAERVLQEDPSNIAALRMLALHAATQLPLSALEEGGEIKPLAEQLSLLLKNMNKSESHNFSLYLATGHLFQTLMLEPRHTGSLKVILAMIDKAIFVLREFPMGTCDDKLSEVLCERGAVLAASGDPRGGMENYKEASAVDAANVNALHGMIHCQILLGANNDAMEQLDLVKMMSDGEAPDAKLLVLEAHLSVQPKQRLKLLDKASKALKKSIRNTSKELMRGPEKGDRAVGFCFGEVCLNASEIAMCVEMASLYLKCSESDGLERAGSVLREVIQTSPSLVAAHLLLAEVTLGTDPNHPEVALKVLRRCLQMDPSCAQAHLTIASIAIDRMNNLKLAQQSLDHALGVDFSIRNHPTYHLTRAKLLTAQGSPELALKQLEDAKESSVLTQKDEVDVSIATVQTLIALRRLSEAKDTVKKALGEFKGSSFEVDIIMCEADLLVARGDADAALRVLGNIPQTSNQFTMALRKKAKIQLEERRDKVAYTACFSELVSMATSNEAKHDALKQLGCALLDIQNPGKAVEAFQHALELKPSDAMLAVKIGRALIATHDYRRARDYYDAALKSPNLRDEDSIDLQRDLAKLLIKLRKYEEAASLLSGDSGDKNRDVDAFLLLSDVHAAEVQSCLIHGSDQDGGFDDDHDSATASQNLLDALMRAKQLQQQILSAYSTDSSVAEEEHMMQKKRMTLICGRIADFHARNTAGGKMEAREQLMIQSYKEALAVDPMSEVSMIDLATLFLKRGELELCEEQCETALRCFDEESSGRQDAALMLADVCFVRKDLEGAMEHLYAVLKKQPNHYDALARLIQLLWRAARMDDEVPKLLRRAEAYKPRSFADPGLNYCKGLHKRLAHDPHGALQLLNLARRDGAWGPASLSLMISIYIEPFLESIYDLASKDDNSNSGSQKDQDSPKAKRSSRSSEVNGEESVTIASHLLNELLKMTESMMKEGGSPSYGVRYGMSCSGGGGIISGASVKRHAVLALRTLVAEVKLSNAFVTKNKKVSENDMDELAQKMVDVLESDKEFTPAMLALAAMFMLQEQDQKARNMLKRIVKMPYTADQSEAFETAYMVLAQTYIGKAKYDLAQDLCKRCLQYNKSGYRAHETLGSIYERECAYKDAASSYEEAWKFTYQGSPSIGYELAFNYLKAKRFVEAIDVANEVIKRFPSYPKIKQDVLQVAIGSLKP